MPIITKPSEALKLALTVMNMDVAPWLALNLSRGSHIYTCNCLAYLESAEEITEEAMQGALEALWLNSKLVSVSKDAKWSEHTKTSWFRVLGSDDRKARIAAINLTIQQLEEKGQ